jgi:hypothetical protein
MYVLLVNTMHSWNTAKVVVKHQNLLVDVIHPVGTYNTFVYDLRHTKIYVNTHKKPGKHIYVQWLHDEIRAYQIPP